MRNKNKIVKRMMALTLALTVMAGSSIMLRKATTITPPQASNISVTRNV